MLSAFFATGREVFVSAAFGGTVFFARGAEPFVAATVFAVPFWTPAEAAAPFWIGPFTAVFLLAVFGVAVLFLPVGFPVC